MLYKTYEVLVSISHRFHRRLGKPRSLQWNKRLGLQRIVTWVWIDRRR